MFKYFILRAQQQLFCYFCGIVLAMVLMLLFPSVFRGSGFYLLLSSVVLFWAGLALYTRHIDRMRKPEVSPLVSIRDGIQVVAEMPRHEKARLEWEILRDDEVFRQQRWELTGLTGRVISRGLLYTPAVMLVGIGILAWVSPQDAIRLIDALRNMPAAELVHQIGFVLSLVLQISVISVLIADVVAGRGLPNVFRRALLDRLPAEFCLIRRGTER
ncbi:hypothetical protein AAHZ29_26290 (plasmid) [Klebsiella pneumoniae]|uniref:hypothetical protein n=1 Tax=Klebsiella pneumoniae complex TaxID=3390273 RepID=UPI000949F6DA|nr:hypothetical protein [Klebsiella pneumoniae]EIW8483784.1 hypothetical protein [Klebsiella pneumoniae]OLL10067.1 hypothetical protein KLPP_09880 [Klebsiella pneumoniae subsp. pneumoniae]WEE34423.1 hypothetical protein PX704_25755 [Klebsiella pneumoniae subsp. pneumoniae]SYG07377.1 Uncharacterised protein [Klebsiella pneumoniae]HBR1413845.1 hypothetical protein [Klebsiella pneumoniae]